MEALELRSPESSQPGQAVASHQPRRDADTITFLEALGIPGASLQPPQQETMARKCTKVLQNVSLSKRRCGFTHVAMICDDTSLQPRLPLLLIGNEVIFPVAKLESMRPSLRPNVRLWRRKTGWVSTETMRDILRELSAALGELTATRTVVLLMDTAPVHTCARFINLAARHKIAVQFIPAKLTWLLQPLDTHAFARFKLHALHQYRAHVLRSAHGECELTAVLESVISAIRHVLQGVVWAKAFDGNGYGTHGQAHLRTTILKEMEWESLPELPASLPEYANLTAVFPRRRNIPLAAMLRPYREQEAEPPAVAVRAELPAADVEARPLPHPWFGRLRGSSHLVAPQPIEMPPPLPPPAAEPPAEAPPPSVAAPLPVPDPSLPPLVRFPVGRRLPVLPPRIRRAGSADA